MVRYASWCAAAIAAVLVMFPSAGAQALDVTGQWDGKVKCCETRDGLPLNCYRGTASIRLQQDSASTIHMGGSAVSASSAKCILATSSDGRRSTLGCAQCGSDDLNGFGQFAHTIAGKVTDTRLKLVWTGVYRFSFGDSAIQECKYSYKRVDSSPPVPSWTDCSTP